MDRFADNVNDARVHLHRRALGALLIAIGFLTSGTSAAATLVSGFNEVAIGGLWNEALAIKFGPNGRMFVLQRGGIVRSVENDTSSAPILDISEEIGAFADHGMVGFALHPNYYVNGYIYVAYVVDRHHLLNCNEPAAGIGEPECGPGYNPNQNTFYAATMGRVTRYTLVKPGGEPDFRNATTVDYTSRTVLMGALPGDGCPILHNSHGVGEIMFATDGSLLVACGDGASANGIDTGTVGGTYWADAINDGIIQPEENVGAFRSQLLDSHSGKILRIDPDTGDGLASNPFYDPIAPRSARSRVWILGVRNAFRMTLRPGTGSHAITDGDPGTIYFGEVGWNTWEEFNISDGPGQNFGWPVFEGMDFSANTYATQPEAHPFAPNPLFGSAGCDAASDEFFSFQDLILPATLDPAPVWPNPCEPGTPIPPTVDRFVTRMPVMTWNHDALPPQWSSFDGNDGVYQDIGSADPNGDVVNGPASPGNASVGGTWYTGDLYPAEYKDTYFHGDYGQGWIRNFKIDANDQILRAPAVALTDFLSAANGVVEIAYNPADEKIYYIDWTDSVYRIDYIGDGNFPPNAIASQDLTYGASPLAVQFSSAGSSDPEDGPLTYFWDFGDGNTSTDPNPSHTFDPLGAITVPTTYTVTLTVTDDQSETDVATQSVSINNTPPSVAITSPVDLSQYTMTGDSTHTLSANISDSEHTVGELSCSWTVYLHHNTHSHNNPPDTSCSTSATISPIGCTGESYFYRFVLTVTDPGGLKTTDEVTMFPDCAGGNSPPVAAADSAVVLAADSTVVDVVGNDSDDVALDLASVNIVTPPSFGTITNIDTITGDVTYTHNGSASSSDAFTYTIADNEGLSSNIANVSLAIVPADDDQPPSVPANLLARVTGAQTVKVTWDASIDSGGAGVEGYRVKRDGTEIAFVPTNYLFDIGLALGTTYSYTVSAVDYLDNESAPTAVVPVTTAGVAGLEMRIQAGWNEDYTDTLGNVWLSDQGYNTGNTFFRTQQITNTADDVLFHLQRNDPSAAPELSYTFPLANGNYVVNLYFAETGSVFAAGGRVFDVSIEGSLVLDDYDIFADVGSSAAVFKSIAAEVADGALNIDFARVFADPLIAAIEVVEVGMLAPGVSIYAPAAGADVMGPDVTIQYTLNGDGGAYDHLHFSIDGGAALEDSALTGSFLLTGLADGSRTVTATLVDAAHQPLANPEATDSVTFTVDSVAPTVPTGLAGNATGETTTSLSWNASTDTGGSGLAGYRVYRDTVQIAEVATTTFDDSGLVAGTTYAYTVSAYDLADNESAQTDPIDVMTDPLPDTEDPSVPTGLAGNATGETTTSLLWNASTDTGGSGLAGYRVYRDTVQIAEVATTTFDDSGLVAGTTYAYTVSAYDLADNESAQTDPIDVMTDPLPDTEDPSVPTGLAGNATGETTTSLLWNASTDTGGSGLVGYRVYRDTIQIAEVATTTFDDSGLVAGTTYAYTVSAYDLADNESAQTDPIDVMTDPLPDTEDPSVPTGLAGNATGETTTSLSWNASTDTGGSGLVGYRVYRDTVQIAEVAMTTFDDSGLVAGTTYAYTVSAYDLANNESAQSDPIDVMTDPLPDTEDPSVPTGLAGNATGETTTSLSWNASTDTGGSGLVGYRVYRDTVQIAEVAMTTFDDSGLVAGTTYAYTVSAYDLANNESAQTDPIDVMTDPLPDTEDPSVPTGLAGNATGETTTSLSWNASTDTGGSGLVGYRVYRDTVQIAEVAMTTFDDSGLVAGTTYAYTVSAYDLANNESAQSDPIDVMTDPLPDTEDPSVPTGLAGNATGETTTSLIWNASTDTGGSGLAGYRVYRDTIQIAEVATTTFDDSGLVAGTTYAYTVSAYDLANNQSAQSDPMDLTTDAQPDADGDGVADTADNCTVIANPTQIDADSDGYGNLCDADFNNDGIVNPIDLGLFSSVFFTNDPVADLNSDGVVNPVDLGILKSLFFLPPGPSGIAP